MKADATGQLDAAVAAVLGMGPPGAHLSVRAPGIALDSFAGLAQAFGGDRRPLTTAAAHDLGSVTKIAGTTAMLVALASAGELDVADPVTRYLPGVTLRATLADLLTHRAGLWEWWPTYLEVERGGNPVAAALALPLRYPAGAARHYSDLGFMILGAVVRAVTGMTLPQALDALLTGPAGITGLRYGRPADGLEAAASSTGDGIERRMIATGVPYPVTVDASRFDRWREHVLVGEVNDGNAFHAFGGAAGHAGLFGTAAALHRLGDRLLAGLGGGGPMAAMTGFVQPGPDPGQLLGFRSWSAPVGDCPGTVIGHTGFPGVGFGLLPEHRATVVLATNRLHVTGDPPAFDPMWQLGMAAAHAALHAAGAGTVPPPHAPSPPMDQLPRHERS